MACLLWSMFSHYLLAGDGHKISTEDYINTFKQLAISEMHKSGIPASITLAQGILESGSGNSRLAREANNHFGIKCHLEWDGETILEDDDEANECFRKYPTPEDSYFDHTHFLMSRDRYSSLFEFRHTDYKSWAHGLKKAGYATNPMYATVLITLIERYDLSAYDLVEKDEKLAVVPIPAETDNRKTEPTIRAAKVFMINRIKAVTLMPGETLQDVAERFYLKEKLLWSYNEIISRSDIHEGMTVFLQPKRRKAEVKYHIVKEGETFYSISQLYGIKVSKLYSRNHANPPDEPAVGQRVYMRSTRTKPIKTRRPETKSKELKENVHQPTTLEKESEMPIQSEQNEKTESVTNHEQNKRAETPVKKDEPSHEVIQSHHQQQDPKYLFEPADEVNSKSANAIPESGEIPVIVDNKKVDVTQPESTPVTKAGEPVYHTVEKGHTLYSIARQYNISIAEIKQWNNMPSDTIQIGEALIVRMP